ncbi:MAG: serine/threonine-protein phosphatase [Deltaproteobacteria bacterium]|nr:serine/threonine-protein phosphatase [Deltaproteobacteria bacterium]
MKIAIATHTGHVKKENQDVHAYDAEHGDIVLADGMGGHVEGLAAAKLVCKTIIDNLAKSQRDIDSLSRSLCDAIETANDTLLAGRKGDEISGSTLVAAMPISCGILTAHIGDSRLYRYRSGNIEQLTTDHSRVQEMLQAGLIQAGELARHPMRNVLTRSLGSESPISVDLGVHRIKPDDLFLMCTDGLEQSVPTEKKLEILADKVSTLEQKVEQLMGLALDGPASDNITVIVFQLETDGNLDVDLWTGFPKTVVCESGRWRDAVSTTRLFRQGRTAQRLCWLGWGVLLLASLAAIIMWVFDL